MYVVQKKFFITFDMLDISNGEEYLVRVAQ